MTVAFDIPNPFLPRHPWGERWRQRPPLLTVWHRDPETDGSDDSCGYSSPRLTKDQMGRLRSLAHAEAADPWFTARRAKRHSSPAGAECLTRAAVLLVARVLGMRLGWEEASLLAVTLAHNPTDNLRSSLAFLAGYHSNSMKETKSDRRQCALEFFCCVGRAVLRSRRPWWRHPRWHVRHWSLQLHPLQNLKRWLFSRCAGCGRGFGWGEPPVAAQWDGDGPRWFRGEPGVYHHGCFPGRTVSATGPAAAEGGGT